MRVSAVSYLNTWPLVWGFLRNPASNPFDLRFDLPAQCAAALENGTADIGLVPSAELDRLGLDFFPQLGIACEDAVRSILLISKRPFDQIRRLAADSGSRTSVALIRLILGARYGCAPEMVAMRPQLEEMLADADAALIIGDPALHLDPAALPWNVLDLGSAWREWTGLPMVFAVWAGRKSCLTSEAAEAFVNSWRWGATHMDEIVERAVAERHFPADLARKYLTEHIVYPLTERHLEGLALFRKQVREMETAAV